jgi:hypothetical protein
MDVAVSLFGKKIRRAQTNELPTGAGQAFLLSVLRD